MTYPFPTFNGRTIGVCKLISHFISHFAGHVNVDKRGPWCTENIITSKWHCGAVLASWRNSHVTCRLESHTYTFWHNNMFRHLYVTQYCLALTFNISALYVSLWNVPFFRYLLKSTLHTTICLSVTTAATVPVLVSLPNSFAKSPWQLTQPLKADLFERNTIMPFSLQLGFWSKIYKEIVFCVRNMW